MTHDSRKAGLSFEPNALDLANKLAAIQFKVQKTDNTQHPNKLTWRFHVAMKEAMIVEVVEAEHHLVRNPTQGLLGNHDAAPDNNKKRCMHRR